MGNWLSYLRLIMLILISVIYFKITPQDEVGIRFFIIVAATSLVLNHIYSFFYKDREMRLININIDFVISFLFAFLIPTSSLYLILLGVSAITLFIAVSDKTVLKIYIGVFLIIWLMVISINYFRIETFLFLENITNFLFIVFASIVGSLIRRLFEANAIMDKQFLELNKSHTNLSQTNVQLQQYAQQIEELTKIRERNRIAREIHDTVGHKMTALLVQMELGRELLKLDKNKAEETLLVCDQLARDALTEVRFSVKTLEFDTSENPSFIKIVRKLLEDFYQSSGLKTTLELLGDPAVIPSSLQLILTRTIQESLTNAKRHGSALNSTVRLNCLPEKITLEIIDDGKGASKFTMGFGLRNMRERIEEHGGAILFTSSDGIGFRTSVEFSLVRKQWLVGGEAK